MNADTKEMAQNLTKAHIQCNLRASYAQGCLDTLEKFLQTLNEIGEETEEIGIALIREIIASMQMEVTEGQKRFKKQAASFAAMQKLISSGAFKEILERAQRSPTKKSSLILPEHYRS